MIPYKSFKLDCNRISKLKSICLTVRSHSTTVLIFTCGYETRVLIESVMLHIAFLHSSLRYRLLSTDLLSYFLSAKTARKASLRSTCRASSSALE